MEPIVIDNFLRDDRFEMVRDKILNVMPWHYSIKTDDSPEKIHNHHMYSHIYTFNNMINREQSPSMPLVNPILLKLKPLALLRIKANLQFATETQFESDFHRDTDVPENVPFYTAVFYINTNNGYTIFKDSGQKVESVANRIVIFDGRLLHAGSSCTDQKTRAVININFIPSLETNLEDLKNDK